MQGIAEVSAKVRDLPSGCRSRYELWNGWRREVLVEKASEGLAVESLGEGREFDGELGGGRVEETFVG